ncbi:hypothetical protein Tco_1215585 [Tanacetum coccineum]
MANLKFADTDNMVAFLSKPTKSNGFEQILDFLNAHLIKYALTVNPTIYTSCINQFWSTAVAKTINGEAQLHSQVDGKEIIITEAFVQRDLQLEDENGIDCLPNSTIFEQLALMGPKTTAWNEFTSIMASAVICLETNQKFNFSKLIFESLMKNLDNLSDKFLMHPRITPLFPTMVLQNQAQMGEGSAILTDPHHTPTITQPSTSTQPQKTQKLRKLKRKNIEVPQPSGSTDNVTDDVVHKELGDSLVRAATTASSLEAKQDSGNINKTRSKATLNEPSSTGTSSGSGPMCQETMGNTIAQTRFENISKLSNDSLLARGSRTHGMKRLRRVGATARVESSGDEEDLGEDPSKQRRRINVINADEQITLVSVQNDADKEMFDLDALNVSTAATTVTITTEEITLAQALEELKTSKSKVKGIVFQEPGESTATTIISSQQSQDKAEIYEANIAWDDIQAKVYVDYQLAERLQAKEQEQFTIKEKATLFKELLEQRRKHFAAKRAEDKRNKPPTKTQQNRERRHAF